MLSLLGLLTVVIFLHLRHKRKDRVLLRTATDLFRGTRSERDLVLKLLKQGIPSSIIFHDLYVKKRSGRFAQIDLVVPTKVGIIVFEVKDYSGWIFGRGYQNYWMQVLAYGQEKYRFYNPIKQNEGHIEALKWQLKQVADVPFYSVIVFYGDCVLRDVSCIPDNTYIVGPRGVARVMEMILESNPPAVYVDKRAVIRILRTGVQNGAEENIQMQHIEQIRDMINDL